MVRTTKQQRDAILRRWKQDSQGMSYLAFRRCVQPTFGCDGAVTVKWCGMWLCIERDGYTHS